MSWTEIKRETYKALYKRYKDNVIKEYFGNGMTIAQIATTYGLTRHIVNTIIQERRKQLEEEKSLKSD